MESYEKAVYFDQYGIVRCVTTTPLHRHPIFPETAVVDGAMVRVPDMDMVDTHTNKTVEHTAYMLKGKGLLWHVCLERAGYRADY